MKKIVFIRHAKSSWEQDVSDLKRPLNTRGCDDAKLVSTAFKAYDFKPNQVFSSPAKRTLTTCQIFMDQLGLPIGLLAMEDALYDFGGEKVLRFIKSLDNSLEKVMIFGHNYALTTLVNNLGDVYIDNLSTSGLVLIHFDSLHWKNLIKGHTEMVLKPKDFK